MSSKRGWYQLALQHALLAEESETQAIEKPLIRLVNEGFEFGGGEVLTATKAFIYPVIIDDHLVESTSRRCQAIVRRCSARQPLKLSALSWTTRSNT